MGDFINLKLSDQLIKSLLRKGYTTSTQIQNKTISLIVKGTNVVATAPTGSGKTVALLIIMFEKLRNITYNSKSGCYEPRGIIICPSPEIVLQIENIANEIGYYMKIKVSSLDENFQTLHENPEIIIATPVQLSHIQTEMLSKFDLSNVILVALDEGDRLCEPGTVEQLTLFLNNLPLSRQTVVFSKTLSSNLIQFSRVHLNNYSFVGLDEMDDEETEDEIRAMFDCFEDDEAEEIGNIDFNPDQNFQEEKTLVESSASTQILASDDDDGNNIHPDKEGKEMGETEEDEEGSFENSNEVSLSKLKQRFENPWLRNDDEASDKRYKDHVTATTTKIIEKTPKPHRAFVPSECPLNVRSNVKLLMWNTDVALKSHFFNNDQVGFVEVDFRDQAIHHNLIYSHSPIEYRMGHANMYSLILMSCPNKAGEKGGHRDRHMKQGTDDEENSEIEEFDNDWNNGERRKKMTKKNESGAWIHFRGLSTGAKEWNLQLPSNEQPIGCCAVGNRFAVILTDRYVRYFDITIGVFQLFIESIHGNPVTIASFTGSDDLLPSGRLVVVVDDGRQLIWRMEQFASGSTRWIEYGQLVGSVTTDWFPLPLSRNASLSWIGFSDSGALITVDSKQRVRRLHMEFDKNTSKFRSTTMRWVPVLDLRQAMPKEQRDVDSYFPVGFVDRRPQFTGALTALCRDSRYPPLKPLPSYTVVPFSVPFIDPKKEAVELEHSFLLNEILPDWSLDFQGLYVEEKKLMLKLFASSVLQDQDTKAFGIAQLMPDSQVIQLAIRYAAANKKMNLAQRLGALALEKDNEITKMTKFVNGGVGEDQGIESKETAQSISIKPDRVGREIAEIGTSKQMADKVLNLLKEKNEGEEESEKENKSELQNPFLAEEKPASRSPVKRTSGVSILDQLAQSRTPKMVDFKNIDAMFGSFEPKEKKLKLKRPSRKKLEGSSQSKVKKIN